MPIRTNSNQAVAGFVLLKGAEGVFLRLETMGIRESMEDLRVLEK